MQVKKKKLIEFNNGTKLLEQLLEFVSVFLRKVLLQNLWCRLDELLSL
jgi:hypothetical protein